MEKKKIIKDNFLNAVILILFIFVAMYFAKYHEHWADEAQSWLIARDNSVIEILNYTRYEGTPCLWFLILKLFINIGFTYDNFYLIPIIFTSIGLYLILFKTNLPWYIKLLLPFSYFIFFQTTIVCRSYCLVLPLIILVYLFYPERFNKPIRFFTAMIFFMNISLHTYLITGSIFVIYLYDFYRKRKDIDKNLALKNFVCQIILFLNFIIILILLFPKTDIGFGGDGGNSFSYILGEATISSYNPILNVIAVIWLFVILFKNNNLENIVKILVLFLPVMAILIVLHCQIWHISIIFELIFVLLIKDINKIEVKIFIMVILVIQLVWNVQTLKFDYVNLYSPSEQIAKFIKKLDYKKLKIYGAKYMVTSIQPYFEKNLFQNYKTDKANYCWSINNGYYTYAQMQEEMPDICIINLSKINEEPYRNENIFKKIFLSINNEISKKKIENEENSIYISNEELKNLIQEFKKQNYSVYRFIGNLYTKNLVEETQTFLVYVNEQIEEEVCAKNLLEKEELIIY